jgi:hypothetical protein
MLESPTPVAQLEARLQHLERHLHRARRLQGLTLAGFAVLALAGAYRGQAASEIRTNRLVILDRQHRARIVLQAYPNDLTATSTLALLTLSDTSGRNQAQLLVGDSLSGLMIGGFNGRPDVYLGLSARGEPMLALRRAGHNLVRARADLTGRGSLQLADTLGRRLAEIP